MKRILLFGASGFLGQSVVEKLLKNGHQLSALSRTGDFSNQERFDPRVHWMQGDLYQTQDWQDLLNSHDIVIDLVGIVKEVPEQGLTYEKVIVAAAKTIADTMEGRPDHHLIFVSTNLSSTSTPKAYRMAKKEAEDYILGKDFQSSIVRPSFMYGERKAGSTEMAEKILSKLDPASPDWKNRPIQVGQVAETISKIVHGQTTKVIHENGEMA